VSNMAEAMVSAPDIEIPVSFDVLVGEVVPKLGPERLHALQQAIAVALRAHHPAQSAAADQRESERQAAIARSRESRRQSLGAQEETSRLFDELMKKWGIDEVEPVGPERLKELMLEDGIRPEDNIASREIIAMREE